MDKISVHRNNHAQSCFDISKLLWYGFDDVCTSSSYDTLHFTASEMCLECGGGESIAMLNESWYVYRA